MALVSPCDELISDEWFGEVKKIVGAEDGDGDGDHDNSICREGTRVLRLIAEGKPAAYCPQIVALGPYYHRALVDVPLGPHALSRVSHMEMKKLNSLKSVVRPDPGRIRKFHQNTVLRKKSELEQFYNWKMDTEEGFGKFAWMMTVDAFFLHHFLEKEFVISNEKEKKNDCDSDKSRPPYHSATGSIKCDIVKLENQIPLFLLKEVHLALHGNDNFDKFLKERMATLCSFEKAEFSSGNNVEEEQHLLGCMHKCVSSFLRLDEGESGSCFQKCQISIGASLSMACQTCCFPQAKSGPKDFRMNAAKLIKHGITLMPFTVGKRDHQIRFDRYSATLYLPRLTVSDMFTEVVLRNMLALEFIETSDEAVVTQYVELMKSLINTAKDVKLLRKHGVIVPASAMISDDYIVAMWKDISKPFFAGSGQPSTHFEHIKEALHRNYYIAKGKGVFLGKTYCLVQTPLRLVRGIFMSLAE